MSIHVTKTYNMGGLTGVRQNAVRNVGEKLGYKEISLFRFPDRYDSDEELHVRMDGIVSALCPGDLVLFQHPSGESPRYDFCLFEHIKRYSGTKIIAFVQASACMHDDLEYGISEEIQLLNQADMHIFASESLRKFYIENGLEDKPYIIQEVQDYRIDISAPGNIGKKLYVLTENDKKVHLGFGLDIEVIPYDENRIVETILNISKGGIGLIWDRDETALGIYMAAGIPVIVKRGLSCEDYVLSHNIGMVISEFSEIYGLVSLLDEDSISIYYENVKKTRKLFIEGVYTQKLLIDAYILAQEL